MGHRLAAVMLVAMTAQAQGGTYDRTYSNVCVDPKTSDMGGILFRIGHDAGKPTILLKICGGECWQYPTSEIAINGNRISFSAVDPVIKASRRFTAIVRENNLLLESSDIEPQRQSLRRLRPGHAIPNELPIGVDISMLDFLVHVGC